MSQFKALLRQRILTLTYGKSRVKVPRKLKGKAWAYPLADELAYQKFIINTVKGFRGEFLDQVARSLKPVLPSKTRLDAADNWDLALDQLVESQKATFNKDKQQNFLGGLFNFAKNTADFNSGEWDKFVEGAVGTVFHEDEPWLKPLLDDWAHTNFDLIKSLSDQYIHKANTIVQKAVNEGLIYSEVMSKLQDMDASMTRKKAKLIARDQIGKLNGQLSQKRMEAAEIELYVWETVGDERVRGNPAGRYPRAIPSHYAIDGKVCRWDDAGVYRNEVGEWVPRTALMPTSHPGQEILCRCVAIPYLDDIFAEIAASDGTTVQDAPGVPPEIGKALAAVKGLPESFDSYGNPYVPMQTFVKSTATPEVFHSSPLQLDSKTILEKGKPKVLFFDHLTSTNPGVDKPSLVNAMQQGWTPEPIKVVKYQGQQYIYGQDSHETLARLRLLGDYRGRAIVYDMDADIAKTAVKLPKTPLPKASPIPAPVLPKAAPAPLPMVKAPKDAALEWLATKPKDVTQLGVPFTDSSWSAPLDKAGLSLNSLTHKPKWVPVSDLVFTPGAPDYDWVSSLTPHGNDLPKAVKIGDKVYVTNGKANLLQKVALAQGDPTHMVEVSLAPTADALKDAVILQQKAIAQAAKVAAAATESIKASGKALDFTYSKYIKTLEAMKAKFRNIITTKKPAKAALIKAKEWLDSDGFKKLVKSQYVDKIIKLARNHVLTKDVVEAMRVYKGSTYRPWNKALRGFTELSGEHQDLTRKLDTYFANAPLLQEDTRLYRGLGLDWELNPDTDQGNLLFDGGFISTSTDRGTSEWFSHDYSEGQNKYLLVINAKKGSRFTPLVSGVDGSDVDFNWGEAEFIGDRGQAFRILKVHPKGMTEFEGRPLRYNDNKVQVVEVELL